MTFSLVPLRESHHEGRPVCLWFTVTLFSSLCILVRKPEEGRGWKSEDYLQIFLLMIVLKLYLHLTASDFHDLHNKMQVFKINSLSGSVEPQRPGSWSLVYVGGTGRLRMSEGALYYILYTTRSSKWALCCVFSNIGAPGGAITWNITS